MRVNRAKFAAMAQSCLDVAGGGALALTPAAASISTSARSSTADDAAGAAEAGTSKPAAQMPATPAAGAADSTC